MGVFGSTHKEKGIFWDWFAQNWWRGKNQENVDILGGGGGRFPSAFEILKNLVLGRSSKCVSNRNAWKFLGAEITTIIMGGK